jgi:hypothetical protein
MTNISMGFLYWNRSTTPLTNVVPITRFTFTKLGQNFRFESRSAHEDEQSIKDNFVTHFEKIITEWLRGVIAQSV